jgi:hypothetical protein
VLQAETVASHVRMVAVLVSVQLSPGRSKMVSAVSVLLAIFIESAQFFFDLGDDLQYANALSHSALWQRCFHELTSCLYIT